MTDRREDRKLETNGPVAPKPLARRVGRMRPEVRVLLMWRHFEGPEEAHRAYEHGYSGIEQPFTPEELCRRLTGLLASPRAIGSKKEH